MSRTTIYVFTKDGPWTEYKEFSNSWRSGYFIWKSLQERYLPEYNGKYLMTPEIIEKVWDLGRLDTSPASEVEKVCMLTTFDYALAYREDFRQVAEAYREFEKTYGLSGLSTLGAQASVLEKLAEREDVVAVGWQQTSVSENLWWVQPDDEEDDGRPYNLKTDTKHWNIFEEEEVANG